MIQVIVDNHCCYGFLIKRRDLLASPFFVIHQNLNSSQILLQKHL
nr:MAG TPA: hypothetical protein [Caudoviricetes sp.]